MNLIEKIKILYLKKEKMYYTINIFCIILLFYYNIHINKKITYFIHNFTYE